MSSREYIYIVKGPKTEAFFMPPGFEANVEIHTWGAGGGAGYAGGGSGDTYQRTVTTRTALGIGGYSRTETVTVPPGVIPSPGAIIEASVSETFYSDWTLISKGSPDSSAFGGGGGYAKSTVTVSPGDFIEIAVGGQGRSGPREGSGLAGVGSYIGFNGGASGVSSPYPGGDDQYIGAGGGGGAATAVLINGTPVVVGAGGGGGGGGSNYQTGTVGLAGGVATAVNSDTRGANSADAYATGGGGGGGYPYGGEAGASVGDDAGGPGGGNGGQNYGNITVAGSGVVSGGKGTTYAPTSPPYGNAGYPGYAVLILQRKFRISVKDTSWKSVDAAWVKTPDEYITISKEVLGPSETKIFNSVGSTSFTVPADVHTITVRYPTPTRLISTDISVTPGQVIPVTIGDYNETSSFGAISAPAYSQQVFRYVGNIDHITDVNLSVATATGVALTTSGYNSAQISQAATKGITYDVTYEGWHGDLYSTVYFTPVPTSTVLTNINLTTGGGGRYGAPSIITQPTRANPVASVRVAYDPGSSEGSYDSTVTLLQKGHIQIVYATNLPPVTSLVNTGGWKEIKQAWTKVSGVWKSILNSNSIKSLAETTTVYTSLLTDTFVVPAGCTRIYAGLIGGGGGGGGYDSPYAGVPGFSGSVVRGVYSVTPGDVITIGVGGGGGRGGPGTGVGAGVGGSSSLGFGGGRGGNPGGIGWSGGGGGGGAASVLKINGSILAVASGGGGGGGGGNHSPGIATKPAYSNSGQYYGTAGQDKSGDGGGAGGGGGGYNGGAGGATYGGDDGAYCGSDGADLVPGGWVSGKAGNQGAAYTNGQQGSITISYYTP